MYFLGRQKRKSLGEVKSHLMPEDALRTDAGAVVLDHALLTDTAEKVKVLLHYLTENENIIACSNTSPGRRVVVGYSGLLGESG